MNIVHRGDDYEQQQVSTWRLRELLRFEQDRMALLTALKAMMKYYDTPAGPAELLEQATAAIAKAEGR